MRVLHILNELKPSGAETMLHAAALYWRQHGLEGDILCTGSIPGAYAHILEEDGYHIYCVPFSRSLDFFSRIYRFLKKQRYDAIHIHTERANFWYGMLAYLAGNRCIIRTTHNVFQFRKFLKMQRRAQRWAMRRIFGVKMVAIGLSVKDNECKRFANPTTLIPNWLDSVRFKPPSMEERSKARKALTIPDDFMVLVSIGICSPQKNHPSIIEALARLPASVPVLYLHVGPEEINYPERRLAQIMGVSSRVRFLGTVLDIIPVLSAADIYIMPSLYEGFGVAAIEAMGAGLPAILSDVAGLRDFREVREANDIYWIEPTPNQF
jgi:glycosyltransferase involved in cell wall biosynthesis